MSLGAALIWKMGGDTSKFNKSLDTAQGRVKSFASNALKVIGPLLIALGAGGLGRAAIDLGSKISDMAVQLNIGTTELQVLDFAAREAGVGTEILARALRNAQLRTEEAIKGNKSYGDAFKQLGINVEDFKNLKTEEKLEAIAKAQANATDKAAAYNAVSRILGEKAGPALQEVLQNLAGSEGFGGLEVAAERAGEVMSKETIAHMDAAADKIESFKRQMTVMTGEILGKVVPGFSLLTDGLGITGEIVGTLISSFSSFFGFLSRSLGAVLAPANLAFQSLAMGMKSAAQAASGNFDSAAESIKRSTELSKEAFESLKDIPSEIAANYKRANEEIEIDGKRLEQSKKERAERVRDNWKLINGEIVEDEKKTTTEIIGLQKETNVASADAVVLAADKLKLAKEQVNVTKANAKAVEGVRDYEAELVALQAESKALLASINDAGANRSQIAARTLEIEKEISDVLWSQYDAKSKAVKIGTGGDNVAELSTDKLEYTLREQKKELEAAKDADSAGAFKVGTAYIQAGIQSFISQIEAELATRAKFTSLTGSAQQLAFDPYEIERLLQVITPQSEAQQQTQILKDIDDKLDIQNSRAPVY